jgi:hypothetical protein
MQSVRCIALGLAATVVIALPASEAEGNRAGTVYEKPAAGGALNLGPGRAQGTLSVREPSGVILLARIAAPRGVRAFVNATIPGIAGVTISTVHNRRDPSLSCRLHGGVSVCTQAEQWCPMPAATWRLHVVKQSGPAGQVQIDFVVGPKPRT